MKRIDFTGMELKFLGFESVPERIRTSDLQFRKLLLYPAELLGQMKIKLLVTQLSQSKIGK